MHVSSAWEALRGGGVRTLAAVRGVSLTLSSVGARVEATSTLVTDISAFFATLSSNPTCAVILSSPCLLAVFFDARSFLALRFAGFLEALLPSSSSGGVVNEDFLLASFSAFSAASITSICSSAIILSLIAVMAGTNNACAGPGIASSNSCAPPRDGALAVQDCVNFLRYDFAMNMCTTEPTDCGPESIAMGCI